MAEEAERQGRTMGLSITGAAALFLALRLFAITDYHWGSAFAVAETVELNDAPTVVVGTFMANPRISGIVLAVLLPLTVIRLQRNRWRNAGYQAVVITLGAFTATLVITYQAWWVLALIAGVAAVLTSLLMLSRNDRGYRFAAAVYRRTGLVIALGMLLIAATVSEPWVPRERIETTSGTHVGYVMGGMSSFPKVLLDDTREMKIIDANDITSREEIEPAE